MQNYCRDYNMDDFRKRDFDVDEFPVGMTYVPWQKLDKIYENLGEAFHCGTLFPELNKPFIGRRCVKR